MAYNVTLSKHTDARIKIDSEQKYPKSHYTVFDGQPVTLDKLSSRLLVNPANYLKDLKVKTEALDAIAKDFGLVKVMLTLTLKNQVTNPTDAEIYGYAKELQKLFRQILQLHAWTSIPSHLRLYLRIVEPHESGIPHFHVCLWLQEEYIEKFFTALLNKAQCPQIKISAEYIPKKFEKNACILSREKINTNYCLKKFEEVTKGLEKDILSDLAVWYSLYPLRLYSISNDLAPFDLFRKVKKFFSYCDFTHLYKKNLIEIIKNKKNKPIMIIFQNEILWEHREFIDLPNEKPIPDQLKPYSLADLDMTNALHHGKLSKHITSTGAIEYHIEEIPHDGNKHEKHNEENTQPENNWLKSEINEIKNLISDLKTKEEKRHCHNQASFLKTDCMAKYLAVSKSFLEKNMGEIFIEGQHFHRADNARLVRWDVQKMRKWLKGEERHEADKQLLSKLLD